MLVAGLFRATRPVLSWDEVATADVAHRTPAQIWELVHHIDAVFGVYYLSIHGWTALFGDSVLSLRLPSILAMAGAAALTGELARRLFGATTGLVAGVLLCLLPNISRYAAEARPYAIVCLFSILSVLFLHRVIERPGAGRWLAYAAAVLGIGAFSLVAMTALAGHLAVVLIRRRRLLLPWLAVVLGVLPLLAPLIWWGLQQRAAQLYWVAPMTPHAVYAFPGRLVGSKLVAVLLAVVLLSAAFRPARPVLELAAVALLPPAVVAVAAFAGTSFWVNRYLLFALLPAMIVAAAALTRIRAHRLVPVAALAVIAVAALPGQAAVRRPTVKNGSDYRTLAAVITRDQRPGDVIVYGKDRTMRAGVGYYLRRDRSRPADRLMQHSAAQTATLKAGEYPDPDVRLAGAARIWLVVYGRHADPTTVRPDLRQALSRGGFQRSGEWQVKRGTMVLYTRRTTGPG